MQNTLIPYLNQKAQNILQLQSEIQDLKATKPNLAQLKIDFFKI